MAGDLQPEQYRAAFDQVQRCIQAGDCYQINLTQRFRAPRPGRSLARLSGPAPSLPDAVFRLPATGRWQCLAQFLPGALHPRQPGAGGNPAHQGHSRPRASDPIEDKRNAEELLHSPKDRLENLMIVDSAAQRPGAYLQDRSSVKVPELFSLESYPNVHHLVSSITGQLASDKDALDLIGDSFPGGSITGAPKIRAMQIIDELEPARRALTAARCCMWMCAARWTARLPFAACWSRTARSVAGAAVRWWPTRMAGRI